MVGRGGQLHLMRLSKYYGEIEQQLEKKGAFKRVKLGPMALAETLGHMMTISKGHLNPAEVKKDIEKVHLREWQC